MKTVSEYENEIEANIRMAVSPSGDFVNLREREQAARYLLDHADSAYSRLIELVKDKPGSLEAPRLIELIGLFKQAESIELMQELLLQGIPDTSRAAARALSTIGTPEANHALQKGLRADVIEVRIATIDAVRLTGNKTWCTLVHPALQDVDANLRYYAVNTAVELGCLDAKQLNKIVKDDNNEHVRKLASRLIKDS